MKVSGLGLEIQGVRFGVWGLVWTPFYKQVLVSRRTRINRESEAFCLFLRFIKNVSVKVSGLGLGVQVVRFRV